MTFVLKTGLFLLKEDSEKAAMDEVLWLNMEV